ncbi:O-antigen ligase family protein [Geobacillus stearothermophilus]|uniref:O-antigen ligase family protein n=1 Tax=Geobacillus stearothermophilus TaxID=1422 RepID=UPI003D1ED762
MFQTFKRLYEDPISVLLICVFFVAFLTYIPKNIESQSIFPYGIYLNLILMFIILFLSFLKNPKMNKEQLFILYLFFILFIYSLSSSLWSFSVIKVAWRVLLVFVPIFSVGMALMSTNKVYSTIIVFYRIHKIIGTVLSLYGLVVFFLGDISWIPDGSYMINSFHFIGFNLQQSVFPLGSLFRISSFTANPNILGYLLLISISSTFALFYIKKLKFMNFLVSILLQISALILTFSRNNIIVTLLILLVSHILLRGIDSVSKKVTRYLVTILILMIFLILFSIALFYPLNSSRISLDTNGREEIWLTLIKVFQENWLFGIGFASSGELVEKIGFSQAHNFHIALITELGIIGYLLFVLIFLYITIVLFKRIITINVTSYPIELKVPLIFNFCIIICLVTLHQFFEFQLLTNGYLNYIWAFLVFSAIRITSFLKTK